MSLSDIKAGSLINFHLSLFSLIKKIERDEQKVTFCDSSLKLLHILLSAGASKTPTMNFSFLKTYGKS